MKQVIRLTESDLHRMIKESVKQVLKETSLYTDDPYHYNEYYDEDPREEYPNGKQGDIDYSWDEFDIKNGNMPFQKDNQHYFMNLQAKAKNIRDNWTAKELQRAEKQKQRYLGGKNINDFTQEY